MPLQGLKKTLSLRVTLSIFSLTLSSLSQRLLDWFPMQIALRLWIDFPDNPIRLYRHCSSLMRYISCISVLSSLACMSEMSSYSCLCRIRSYRSKAVQQAIIMLIASSNLTTVLALSTEESQTGQMKQLNHITHTHTLTHIPMSICFLNSISDAFPSRCKCRSGKTCQTGSIRSCVYRRSWSISDWNDVSAFAMDGMRCGNEPIDTSFYRH